MIAGSKTSETDKSTPSLEEIVLEEDSVDLESFLADENLAAEGKHPEEIKQDKSEKRSIDLEMTRNKTIDSSKPG